MLISPQLTIWTNMIWFSKRKETENQPQDLNQEDNVSKQLYEAVESYQASLSTLSLNTLDYFKRLHDLTGALAGKASNSGFNRTTLLLEARGYLQQALDLMTEHRLNDRKLDHTELAVGYKSKCALSHAMQAICLDLYWETKQSKYLDEGIEYGRQATGFLQKHRYTYGCELYRTLYSRCLNSLSASYKARFDDPDPEVGGVENDLDSAIIMQTDAINDLNTDEDTYPYFCKWCDLMVIKSGLSNDLKYITNAIAIRSEQDQPAGDLNFEQYQRAEHNDAEYVALLCRKWQMTGADNDFKNILEEARSMTQREMVREDSDQYLSGRGDTKDVLRVCVSRFQWKLTSEGSGWERHVPTLETAIALCTKLVNMIPIDTKGGIEERDIPIMWLTAFTKRLWIVTKKPVHGFESDAMNVHAAQQKVLMNMVKHGHTCFSDVRNNCSSYGKSNGSGQMFSTFDPPSLPLRQQRFCFVGEIAPENWIRERNDDGTLELGATEDDADVWEFIEKARRAGKTR